MAHYISAVLFKGPFDERRAKSFDLRIIPLSGDITMFPLHPGYLDAWSAKIGISGFVSDRPLLNSNLVHHMMNAIATEPLFAVVETDYFGGRGSQAAAVYRGATEVMRPAETSDETGPGLERPINLALRILGIIRHTGSDEFDTFGLGKYRHFDELFKEYWQAS